MQTPNLHAQRQAVDMQACPTAATGPLACMSCSSLPVQRHSTHVVSHSELCLYCGAGSSNTSVASRQLPSSGAASAASGSGPSAASCLPRLLPYAGCCRCCCGVRNRGSSSLRQGGVGTEVRRRAPPGCRAAAALGRRRRRAAPRAPRSPGAPCILWRGRHARKAAPAGTARLVPSARAAEPACPVAGDTPLPKIGREAGCQALPAAPPPLRRACCRSPPLPLAAPC